MRGAIHLLVILLTALGAGCATNVNVVFDKREDLSRYRTWDWFPNARADIDAPSGEAAGLDARLARLIEQGLRANGFVRGGEHADFFVTYRLALRRRSVVVEQPSAVYHLSSYSSQGSFLIEGSETKTRIYQEIHLSISITGARGRILWRAQLVQQQEEDFALKLNDAVAILLERFPRQRSICDEAGAATKSYCSEASLTASKNCSKKRSSKPSAMANEPISAVGVSWPLIVVMVLSTENALTIRLLS